MDYQVITDESVDFRIVIQLRNIGVTVYSIAEEVPSITDNSVLSIAFEKNALLITEDKDLESWFSACNFRIVVYY